MKVVYLDIETQHLFNEFEGGQKNKSNINKLKIAVAGTINSEEGSYKTFGEERVEGLIRYLNRFDRIVGYNIFGFDYKVLGSYFQYPEAILGTRQAGIISKTFDVMLEFSHIVNKQYNKDVSWVKLDDIAQRNFGMQKPIDGLLIPGMWRNGKREEVKSYVLNDLKMTERFYLAGIDGATLRYEHSLYGKSEGEKEIYIKW